MDSIHGFEDYWNSKKMTSGRIGGHLFYSFLP